jgi:hypothetical protein
VIRFRFVLLPTALLLGASCSSQGSGPETGDTIAREVFIQVYVELRVSALRGTALEITPGERDRVLTEAGITEEDLLGFVEARGSDVQFMKEVWEEVDSIIQERGNPPERSG